MKLSFHPPKVMLDAEAEIKVMFVTQLKFAPQLFVPLMQGLNPGLVEI